MCVMSFITTTITVECVLYVTKIGKSVVYTESYQPTLRSYLHLLPLLSGTGNTKNIIPTYKYKLGIIRYCLFCISVFVIRMFNTT